MTMLLSEVFNEILEIRRLTQQNCEGKVYEKS